MNKKITKKAPAQPIAGCAAFAPSLTAREVTNQFLQAKRQSRAYSGENDSVLNGLSYAAGLLSANRQPFTQSQFIGLTRGQATGEDGINAMFALFAEWTNHLLDQKKLQKEFNIGEPSFSWIG